MKLAHRISGIALLLSLVSVYFFTDGQVGFSYTQTYSENEQQTLVSCATHPALFLWAVTGIWLIWVLMRKTYRIEPVGQAGLIRRFLAFLVDLYFFVLTLGSFMSLIPLWIEARRTGHFAWHFSRTYSVPTDDYVFLPLSLSGIALLLLYFAFALKKGKQTVGSFVLRTAVSPLDSQNLGPTSFQIFKRLFYVALGVGLWPYTVWKRLDHKGQTWYDRASNYRVSLVEYK